MRLKGAGSAIYDKFSLLFGVDVAVAVTVAVLRYDPE
jgi:hypothetical protein